MRYGPYRIGIEYLTAIAVAAATIVIAVTTPTKYKYSKAEIAKYSRKFGT